MMNANGNVNVFPPHNLDDFTFDPGKVRFLLGFCKHRGFGGNAQKVKHKVTEHVNLEADQSFHRGDGQVLSRKRSNQSFHHGHLHGQVEGEVSESERAAAGRLQQGLGQPGGQKCKTGATWC